ncbi:Extracellular protease [Candidatus Rhodobacter oscarellae]|uniref:Extracellular protease n=1 Tax=Candidatus Rhodobacter oscarellae TaxID=1675527 RepID=A0A0J9EBC9_9RHOB|nr:Extracellular protease [Candidatus Rhodobacter lobularis]
MALGGRFEFITSGPVGQANAAANALTSAGATLLRARTFGTLNRSVQVFDLNGLPLAGARRILAQAAAQTQIDVHNFYRFAQSKPRIFAPQLVGLSGQGGCRANGLRIGMIDGPVDPRHPALAGAGLTVKSVLGPREKATDANHGTGVAALIVGDDPGGALTGFSPGAQLFAASAFAKERRGPAADVERIAAALDWLLSNRARLINMSFAGPSNTALADLIATSARRGAIMVAAVGNNSSTKATYPAASPNVIAVTAVDAAARRYRKANRGGYIEFAAPGVDLYVAKTRGGSYASGTSFAAPIVTGIAAHAVKRGAGSTAAVRSALRRGVTDLGSAGRDAEYGWGLVQIQGC